MKEFVLFHLAKKGIIQYPSTTEDRAVMLLALKSDVVINEFIMVNMRLTDEQINYLKAIV